MARKKTKTLHEAFTVGTEYVVKRVLSQRLELGDVIDPCAPSLEGFAVVESHVIYPIGEFATVRPTQARILFVNREGARKFVMLPYGRKYRIRRPIPTLPPPKDDESPYRHQFVRLGKGWQGRWVTSGGGQNTSFGYAMLTKEGRHVWDTVKLFVGSYGTYKGYSKAGMYLKWELTKEQNDDKLVSILAVCDKLMEEGYDVEVKDEKKEMTALEAQHGPQTQGRWAVNDEGDGYYESGHYLNHVRKKVTRRFVTLTFTCKTKPKA